MAEIIWTARAAEGLEQIHAYMFGSLCTFAAKIFMKLQADLVPCTSEPTTSEMSTRVDMVALSLYPLIAAGTYCLIGLILVLAGLMRRESIDQ